MMKRTTFSFLLIAMGLLNAFSADDVLLKIHDREIKKDEFLRVYNKNNNNNTVDNKSIDEYLEMFINFKLKVIEAEELGYDTLPSFISEFEQYRKQLVKPYLIDEESEEDLIKEAYERSKYELDASHILIRVSNRATTEDTLAAYEKTMAIRKRILDGEDFGKVAQEASEDESARQNMGNLGYFTVFNMVYPFETGAYNTPVGDISMPVRTSFGYHLIKVNNKREYRGDVLVAHIMKMISQNSTEEFKESMKDTIFMIYNELKNGKDFAQLAIEKSDDKASSSKGGELPLLKSNEKRVPPDFLDKCYEIAKAGDYTEPFLTDYGWHIVKLKSKNGLKSYDELKADLAEKVKKDSKRSMVSEETAVDKLKKEYQFKEYKDKLNYFNQILDNTVFEKKWKADKCETDEVVIELDGRKYGQKDFAAFIQSTQRSSSPYSMQVFINEKYDAFIKKTVLDYEESRLDEKYPDYKNLVQEYHDGILLFNIMDEMVWSKALKDSAGLHQFYMGNKSEYMWDERARASIYSSEDESKIKELRTVLKKKGLQNDDAVKEICDTINPFCIEYKSGLYLKGSNEFVDRAKWKKSISKVTEKDNKFCVIQIAEIVPKTMKEFDEAAGLITSDYQGYLEKQWLDVLRDKYDITINENILTGIKNKN